MHTTITISFISIYAPRRKPVSSRRQTAWQQLYFVFTGVHVASIVVLYEEITLKHILYIEPFFVVIFKLDIIFFPANIILVHSRACRTRTLSLRSFNVRYTFIAN